MEKIQVNFLSCRAREMNTDLLPIYHQFRTDSRCYAHTFLKNWEQLPTDENLIRSVSKTPTEFSSPSYNIFFCNDIALRHQLGSYQPSKPQLLLITPNNHYYQLALRTLPNKQDRGSLEKFSHIFVPNPFIKKVIKKHYTIRQSQHLISTETPFSYRLRQESLQKKYRDQFTILFPQAAQKKILFIMLPKQMSAITEKAIPCFSLTDFIDRLGKDWLLVTNCFPLLKQTTTDLSDRVLYINLRYPLENILYFSDLVITNLSFFAHGQMSRKKPCFCLSYQENGFEKYMKKKHPALFLSRLQELFEKFPHLDNTSDLMIDSGHNKKTAAYTAAFDKMHQEITFYQESDPVSEIRKIIYDLTV